MAIHSALLDLMTQECVVEPRTGTSAHGAPTYGAAVTHRCRTVGKTRMIRTASGDEKVSTAQTTLGSSPGVGVQDRITLPDGSQPAILMVASFPDEVGAHHEVIYT